MTVNVSDIPFVFDAMVLGKENAMRSEADKEREVEMVQEEEEKKVEGYEGAGKDRYMEMR